MVLSCLLIGVVMRYVQLPSLEVIVLEAMAFIVLIIFHYIIFKGQENISFQGIFRKNIYKSVIDAEEDKILKGLVKSINEEVIDFPLNNDDIFVPIVDSADHEKTFFDNEELMHTRCYSSKQLLFMIREALEQDRIDMFLQPIVSLPQRKIRFFECYSRL